MIALHEIREGDWVRIQDGGRNLAEGPVRITHAHARVRLTCLVFGVAVPFAEHRPGGWVTIGKVAVVAHQPPLDLEASQ